MGRRGAGPFRFYGVHHELGDGTGRNDRHRCKRVDWLLISRKAEWRLSLRVIMTENPGTRLGFELPGWNSEGFLTPLGRREEWQQRGDWRTLAGEPLPWAREAEAGNVPPLDATARVGAEPLRHW